MFHCNERQQTNFFLPVETIINALEGDMSDSDVSVVLNQPGENK